MTINDIKQLSDRVHIANQKWWVSLDTGRPIERNIGELLMLTVSELAEAMEGDRKNLMDDKLPHRKMFEVEIADAFIRALDIVGGLHCFELMEMHGDPIFTTMRLAHDHNRPEQLLHGVKHLLNAYDARYGPQLFFAEMLGFIAWTVNYSKSAGIDLMGAFEEKMAYNAVRADHKPEHRKAVGGKKY